ncbi:serine hydrolase domain-containing protein [Mucilaginibacter auburnensis]|uniref:CubicO group peptidase (Beta-lactamase class C family) n=1 Tax=Mucilaginibacter auburnensis TaxID=1457233 RepID=A0A2H9VNX4_9SPHI|nr:serine hydrolase domain-containing protein [Mucilaginibacter auburnensis]PJJ80044.1 CubicO group peptidase (beta-lactamase class C family) [Mucilaginibacter auburnensis]
MRRSIIVAVVPFILLLLCGSINPQPQAGSGYDFSAVDKYIEQNMGAYNNHVAVLIMQNNKVIYRKEVNMTIKTNYGIASASKWLSAAVIAALIDEKKIALDDTVGKFLPLYSKYGKGNITIRQLFSHTAGFAGDEGAVQPLRQKFEYRPGLTLAQAADSIAIKTPLANKPGSVFNYGSTSMQIAGRIAEVVTGKNWQAIFDEKIGRPCQMQAVYKQLSTKNPLLAGGVTTSAADYINFLNMLANGGVFEGKQVLSETTVKLMMTDQTRGALIKGTPFPANPYATPPVRSVRYGLGNWLDVLNADGSVAESSSPGLFGTHPWQNPKQHLAGIIFTQTLPKRSQPVSLKIRQMVREIVEKG